MKFRFSGAQNSISTKEKLSVDRTIIGAEVRYNWEVQITSLRENDAKVSCRFITESQAALDYWVSTHSELAGMNNHQVIAFEMRKRYVALLNTYKSK